VKKNRGHRNSKVRLRKRQYWAKIWAFLWSQCGKI